MSSRLRRASPGEECLEFLQALRRAWTTEAPRLSRMLMVPCRHPDVRYRNFFTWSVHTPSDEAELLGIPDLANRVFERAGFEGKSRNVSMMHHPVFKHDLHVWLPIFRDSSDGSSLVTREKLEICMRLLREDPAASVTSERFSSYQRRQHAQQLDQQLPPSAPAPRPRL